MEDFCLSRLVAGISRVCDECPFFLGGLTFNPRAQDDGSQRLLLGMFHGGDIAKPANPLIPSISPKNLINTCSFAHSRH